MRAIDVTWSLFSASSTAAIAHRVKHHHHSPCLSVCLVWITWQYSSDALHLPTVESDTQSNTVDGFVPMRGDEEAADSSCKRRPSSWEGRKVTIRIIQSQIKHRKMNCCERIKALVDWLNQDELWHPSGCHLFTVHCSMHQCGRNTHTHVWISWRYRNYCWHVLLQPISHIFLSTDDWVSWMFHQSPVLSPSLPVWLHRVTRHSPLTSLIEDHPPLNLLVVPASQWFDLVHWNAIKLS